MKNKILFSVLLVAILFSVVGCNKDFIKEKKEKIEKKENYVLEKDEYSVSLGKTLDINDELSVKLINVNDSRCPDDVECFWEGELEYELVINKENYKISTVLNTTLFSGKYLFVIVPDKCDLKTVTFRVEKFK